MRRRLRSKCVPVTIICPFCNIDVEHLLHVFFYCSLRLAVGGTKVFSLIRAQLNQRQSGCCISLIQLVVMSM